MGERLLGNEWEQEWAVGESLGVRRRRRRWW